LKYLLLLKVTLKIEDIQYKRYVKSKILFIFNHGKKREALSLETKYDILREIEKWSKTKTEIAKDFQVPKSTLLVIMSKMK
jgi:hypothetical protein